MNKKRGFTLIELLVVIAIIALLMSILMPALAKVRKQAMLVADLARQKQVGIVTSMYTSENNGFFNAREVGTVKGYARMWPYLLKPYYKDPLMRFCPTAVNPKIVTGPFGCWNYQRGDFHPTRKNLPMPGESEYDWEAGKVVEGFFTGSYGMNRWIEDLQGGGMEFNPGYWRRTDVRGGDKVPVFLDCQYLYFWPSGTAIPPAYNGDYTAPEMHWITMDRHLGYNNVVFLDFSARKVGLKELYTLKYSRTSDTCGPWTLCGFNGNKTQCATAWDGAALWMRKMPEY
jgi:prepilin-type N-terminal cleavage/methylation domain-containing protein